MAKTADKKEKEKGPSIQSKISGSLLTIIAMAIYTLMGLSLCYLKIVFGDYSRDEELTHAKFTGELNPLKNMSTTPSVPYYFHENKTNYVKQFFVGNPNFIMNYASKAYSKSGKDQMLKTIFLETCYILFGALNILEDIPNWSIILAGPIIWVITIFFIAIFNWLVLSYNIFSYFLSDNHFFAKWYIGWLAGFICWMIFMVYGGFVTIGISVIYGLYRFALLLGKTEVFKLNVTEDSPTTSSIDNSTKYGFSKFLLDMTKSSTAIHLIIAYTIYSILGKFSKEVSIAFIVIVALSLLYYMGSFSFITQDQLKEGGWTTYLESIKLPFEVPMEAQVTAAPTVPTPTPTPTVDNPIANPIAKS